MENPQAQMPQGQPGMEQGQAPQQGGQDQQMQQLMQAVQQMIQQGAQPIDVAAQLLGQQVPPEVIMQVFVEMGLPEQEAQMAIEQAMQGGQQPQGQGQEQMEGPEEDDDEDEDEQEGSQMMPPGMQGQPPMAFGGQPRRMLRKRAEGGGMDPAQEMEAVMQQVQGMMEQGADARQVMEQIQAAAQQGEISPEVATQVLEQLSGMQQAQDPQGSDTAMTEQSQDPQQMDPNVAAPEAQMMRFGGNLKKLMKKAYGGEAISPNPDSKTYVKDRANMFVNSVKNNAFKSTLDDEFPSLSGNQMAYGGNLPKADKGFDVTSYKTADEAELAARRYYDSLDEEKKKTFDWKAESGKWKEPEFKFEAGKQYELDPATGKPRVIAPKNQFQFQEGDVLNQDAQGAYITHKDGTMQRIPSSNSQAGYNVSQSAINPVSYQNPLGNTLYDNLYASANPWARLIAGSGNRYGDPRITGANLPGGMSGAQFFGTAGGFDGIEKGMTGKIGDQTWRVTGKEKFKEGSIWKGNRRKGVRYNIDWGTEGAMNPAGPQNNPATTTTNNNATTNNTSPQGSLSKMTKTGGSGMGAMEQFDENLTTTPTVVNNTPTSNNPTVVNNSNVSVGRRTGGSGMGMLDGEEDFSSSTNPNANVNANQNLVAPGKSDVVQPSTEVDPTLQKMSGKAGFSNPGADFVGNVPVVNNPVVNNPVVNQDPASYLDEDESLYPSMKNYGGRVNSADLANAIALINRAFGGMIPRAENGLDLGSEDTDANKIPDYLQAENLPANKPNPFTNKSTLEASEGKKFNVNWDAAADVYATSGAKFANFMDKVSSFQGNQERELAKRSALNRPSDTYDTMDQGMYDQWGNAKPNDLNNQVLNPTDVYRQNQRQVYAYGGRLYEMGGQVDLDDSELEALRMAGFNFRRS